MHDGKVFSPETDLSALSHQAVGPAQRQRKQYACAQMCMDRCCTQLLVWQQAAPHPADYVLVVCCGAVVLCRASLLCV